MVFEAINMPLPHRITSWWRIYHQYWGKEQGSWDHWHLPLIRHPQYTGSLLITLDMLSE